MRAHPHLYELNASQTLHRLSQEQGRTLTLASMPDDEWQRLEGLGMDLVWLMGVWTRSPAARNIALSHPGLRKEYGRAIPGWTDADIAGSPYAVYSYQLDPAMGKPGDLVGLRSRLSRLGLGLVLDFVPNHLAVDSPLVKSHPHWFVHGSQSDWEAHPDWFFSLAGRYVAHGRDPYFPPWEDTAQVNFFQPEMREFLVQQLEQIAAVCDGVRCDMAMLGLNSVFERVWGEQVQHGPVPQQEFWEMAIQHIRRRHPSFLLIAEAYWGLERELLDLGFDYAYDKGFYDALRGGMAGEVLQQIEDKADCQARMVRFIENHDEQRAVEAFGRERSMAAATVIATLPGMRFFHDGQLQGFRRRVPVQLVGGTGEVADLQVEGFYHSLLELTARSQFHEGTWTKGRAQHPGVSDINHDLLVWSWQSVSEDLQVVVNFSPRPTVGLVAGPWPTGKVLSVKQVEGSPKEWQLHSDGVVVNFDPWEAVVIEWTAEGD